MKSKFNEKAAIEMAYFRFSLIAPVIQGTFTDPTKTASFESSKLYCVFGKVNSSDKLYLVLDGMKEDKKNAI
jgi:hypothetical protein